MYSENPLFDLYENREEQKTSWEMASYESIPDTTVLQAMGACLCKSCKGADILSLDKDEFIDKWQEVSDAFDMTIDYFKNSFGVPVSKLVPYDALYVPFVYYFYKKKSRPTGLEKQFLQDYFWRSAFSSRFTEGAVSKINQDLMDVIGVIIDGKEWHWLLGSWALALFILDNDYFAVRIMGHNRRCYLIRINLE